MDEPVVPFVRGALVSGPAAYVLSRTIDHDAVVAELRRAGLSDRWRELALAALDAIDREAAAWRADVEVRRQRSSEAGTCAVPGGRVSSGSPAMKLDTVTVAVAAEALQCSPEYVRRLARRGGITAHRVGHEWLIDAAAVAERAARCRPKAA